MPSALLLHAMRCLRPSELPLFALCEPEPAAIDVPMQGVGLKDRYSDGGTMSSSSGSEDDSDDGTLGGTLGQPGQPLNVPALEQQIGRILADDTHPSTQGMDVDMGAGSLVGATMALPLDTRPKRQHDDEGGSSSKGDPSIGPQPRPDGDENENKENAIERPPARLAASAAVRVMESLLKMVHEAPSHWRHFPQFFFVMLEFAKLGPEERELMLRKRVVTLMIDFYLGDESPLASNDDGPHHRPKRTRMGDKYTLPNLEHMVDLIATLVLSSSRTHGTGGNGTHTNVPESTPFSQSPLLLMNPEEQQLATCGPFINKLLKEGLNVPALEALLLHTSYDSEQRSVRHCRLYCMALIRWTAMHCSRISTALSR